MPTLSRIPGQLDLIFVIGDDLPISITIDQDVSGSTWESFVYVDNVSAFAADPGEGFSTTPGTQVFAPTITVVDAATGQLAISMTEAQTVQLSPSVRYRWYLRQILNGDSRTILAGIAEARNP